MRLSRLELVGGGQAGAWNALTGVLQPDFLGGSDQDRSGGQMLYRLNPNYYGGVDRLWVAAEAFTQ